MSRSHAAEITFGSLVDKVGKYYDLFENIKITKI